MAVGIGAIAAAPFTGGGSILAAATLAGSLAGAGTIAAAAGAAVAGGVVGAALSKSDKEERQKEINSIATKHELEKKEILKKVDGMLADTTKIYDFVIAMHAIGMATANADGVISDEEAEEIEAFVSGIMAENFPTEVKTEIQKLTDNPPSLKTAYNYLKKANLTQQGWEDVDTLIEVVILADYHEDEKETAFRNAWDELRKTG